MNKQSLKHKILYEEIAPWWIIVLIAAWLISIPCVIYCCENQSNGEYDKLLEKASNANQAYLKLKDEHDREYNAKVKEPKTKL